MSIARAREIIEREINHIGEGTEIASSLRGERDDAARAIDEAQTELRNLEVPDLAGKIAAVRAALEDLEEEAGDGDAIDTDSLESALTDAEREIENFDDGTRQIDDGVYAVQEALRKALSELESEHEASEAGLLELIALLWDHYTSHKVTCPGCGAGPVEPVYDHDPHCLILRTLRKGAEVAPEPVVVFS